MAITLLKKQLSAIESMNAHETAITNMFASLTQRRSQLVNIKANVDTDPDYDQDDSDNVQSLIDLIDSKFTV